MPSRQNIKRFVSEPVQGKDSFVALKMISLDESNQFARISLLAREDEIRQNRARQDLIDAGEVGPEPIIHPVASEGELQFLSAHIIEWNWVDDNGVSLAQPKDDPSVMTKLTVQEFTFLVTSLTKVDEAKLKN